MDTTDCKTDFSRLSFCAHQSFCFHSLCWDKNRQTICSMHVGLELIFQRDFFFVILCSLEQLHYIMKFVASWGSLLSLYNADRAHRNMLSWPTVEKTITGQNNASIFSETNSLLNRFLYRRENSFYNSYTLFGRTKDWVTSLPFSSVTKHNHILHKIYFVQILHKTRKVPQQN